MHEGPHSARRSSSASRLATEPFFAREEDGTVLGFAGLRVEGADAELTNLFIETHAMGRGFGKQLWQHTMQVARSLGARRVLIASDPFAEGFYRAMGAPRVGEVPSDPIPGRRLPLLIHGLPGADEPAQGGRGREGDAAGVY